MAYLPPLPSAAHPGPWHGRRMQPSSEESLGWPGSGFWQIFTFSLGQDLKPSNPISWTFILEKLYEIDILTRVIMIFLLSDSDSKPPQERFSVKVCHSEFVWTPIKWQPWLGLPRLEQNRRISHYIKTDVGCRMCWYFRACFILILLHAGQGLSENRGDAQVRSVKSMDGMEE